jgi:hypothetical protein
VGVSTLAENQPSGRRFLMFKTALSGVALLFLSAAATAEEQVNDEKAAPVFDHAISNAPARASEPCWTAP